MSYILFMYIHVYLQKIYNYTPDNRGGVYPALHYSACIQRVPDLIQ